MQGLRDTAFPEFAPTPDRDRFTHGTHLSGPSPQIQLCCFKPSCKRGLSPGKRQDWSKFEKVAIFLPKWCKTVPEWPTACTPCPHLASFSHSKTFYNIHMVGAGNEVSMGLKKQIGHLGGVQWWG